MRNYEGFFAGLEDDEFVFWGLSMKDREDILAYVGFLCGGDSL